MQKVCRCQLRSSSAIRTQTEIKNIFKIDPPCKNTTPSHVTHDLIRWSVIVLLYKPFVSGQPLEPTAKGLGPSTWHEFPWNFQDSESGESLRSFRAFHSSLLSDVGQRFVLKILQMCKLNRSALLALQNHGLVDGVSKLGNQLNVCIVACNVLFSFSSHIWVRPRQ